MKFILHGIFVVLAGTFLAFSQSVTWKDINGSPNYSQLVEGSSGKLFSTYGTSLNANVNNGLYYTPNEGVSWFRTQMTGYIEEMEANGSSILITIPDQEYNYTRYYSSDNGDTWLTLNRSYLPYYFNISDSGRIFALAFNTNSSIQAVTYEIPTRHWRLLGTSLVLSDNIYFFKIDHASNFYIGTYSSGMLVSTNRGTSWNTVLSGQRMRSFYVNPNNRILVGTTTTDTTFNGIYSSSDTGKTWNYLGLKSTSKGMIAEDQTGRIYANTNGGIYRYAGSGTGWQYLGPSRTLFDDMIITTSNTILAAGSSAGMYRSTDAGFSWAKTTTIRNETITVLCVDETNTVFAGTLANRIFVSSNSGLGWSQLSANSIGDDINSLLTVDSAIYAGTNIGLFETRDHGLTWRNLTSAYVGGSVYDVTVNTNGEFFAATNFGVYKSTNFGETWAVCGLPNMVLYKIVVTPHDVLAAASIDNGMYCSPDHGQTWNYSGLQDESIMSLAVNSNGDIFAGGYGVVFRSTDDGLTWEGNPFDTTQVLSLLARGRNIFAGTFTGVFSSQDNGTMWKAMSRNGLTTRTILSLSFDNDNNLIAGTFEGGIFITTEPLTDSKDGFTLPEQVELTQNYPNPFNPKTTIRFSISSSQRAVLRIYDILGREVTTLVNEPLHAGAYQFSWDASKQPSGMYFYRLQTGNIIQTRKMIFLK